MKITENGRSMVEMLGVLTLVGLMSIGGMTGYSKMRAQYRINKSIEQIEQISAKLSALGNGVQSYKGLSSQSAIKYGAVPTEAIVNGGANLENPFGGSIDIAAAAFLSEDDAPEGDDFQAYTISYTDLPEEACVAMGSHNWSSGKEPHLIGLGLVSAARQLSLVEPLIYKGCSGGRTNGDTKMTACHLGETIAIPVSVSHAAAVCECPNDTCAIILKYF